MAHDEDYQDLDKIVSELAPKEYPDEVVNQEQETQETIQQPSYEEPEESSQVQKEYKKQHRPLSEDEYLKKFGTMEGYKTPEEWEAYGKVYPEIKSLKEALQTVKQQNDALISSHKKQAEEAVQIARAQLEQRFKFAKETGDIDEVARISEQKAKLDVMQQQEIGERVRQDMERINEVFKDRNKHWFQVNPAYTEEALQLGRNISVSNPQLPYAQVVKQVEDMMLYYHPELVVSNRGVPQISNTRSAVNKSSVSITPQGQFDRQFKSLSQDEKEDFKLIKAINDEMFKKIGVKAEYTIQDFLESKNKKVR